MIIVLTVSQKWQDEGMIEEKMEELTRQWPGARIRMPEGYSGAGKAAQTYLKSIGADVDLQPPDHKWGPNAANVRNNELLTGVRYGALENIQICREGCDWHPPAWPHPTVQEPKADLLLAFWAGSSGDNTHDLIKKALINALPMVVYREKWKGKTRTKPKQFLGLERTGPLKRKPWTLAPWQKLTRERREEAA